MQLGRALVGGIVGAAVGIAVLVAFYFVLKLDSVWLALAVAVLTGLGVRTMVSTWGHASYLRGAITAALALGAYLLGSYVVAGLAQRYASSARPKVDRPAAEAKADAPGDAEAQADAPAEPVAAPQPVAGPAGVKAMPRHLPREYSTFDFILLCISALIAYELGRGTAPKPAVVAEDEPEPADRPPGAHPDA